MLQGSETPRIFTPPLRELTPETSLGFSLIQFAEEILLVHLFPWQRWLAIHALELRPDGRLRFRNVVLLVARQNGKSMFSQVLALWWLFICDVELVLGTAQDLDTAEEVWAGAVNLAIEVDDDDSPVRPELAELVQRVVQVNGKKSLDLVTGSRYKVKAANRRAGRGLTGQRIMLDELREHQTWDAWAAITKTTMAMPDAQVWCLSNAGDPTSVVLHYLRKMAHGPLGDPDGICAADGTRDLSADIPPEETDLGLFEWSAPPGSLDDREGWAQANPSLGYTITEDTIASARRTDPEWIFRTEVLCQWAEAAEDVALPIGTWLELSDPRAPRGAGPVFGLDVAEDRTGWVVVAWRRPDGAAQVMLANDGQPMPAFTVVEECARLSRQWDAAVVPPRAFEADLERAGVRLRKMTIGEFSGACGAVSDALKARAIRHGNQSALNAAIQAAEWRSAGANGERAFRLRERPEAGPLAAMTRALWGLSMRPANSQMIVLD